MPLTAFDHVNIRTADLDGMIEWYDRILGITAGYRPVFKDPGAWLYLNGTCVIHLFDNPPKPPAHQDGENLRLDHVAFRAEGFGAFIDMLEAEGIEHTTTTLEETQTVLVFLRDPDGNHIHVDFAMGEVQ
ncbi:MAG: VOC family protein [Pseudomonadota bacterium]